MEVLANFMSNKGCCINACQSGRLTNVQLLYSASLKRSSGQFRIGSVTKLARCKAIKCQPLGLQSCDNSSESFSRKYRQKTASRKLQTESCFSNACCCHHRLSGGNLNKSSCYSNNYKESCEAKELKGLIKEVLQENGMYEKNKSIQRTEKRNSNALLSKKAEHCAGDIKTRPEKQISALSVESSAISTLAMPKRPYKTYRDTFSINSQVIEPKKFKTETSNRYSAVSVESNASSTVSNPKIYRDPPSLRSADLTEHEQTSAISIQNKKSSHTSTSSTFSTYKRSQIYRYPAAARNSGQLNKPRTFKTERPDIDINKILEETERNSNSYRSQRYYMTEVQPNKTRIRGGRDARYNAIEPRENETYLDRLSRPLSYQTNYNPSNNFCKIKKSSSYEQPKRVYLPVACQPNDFNKTRVSGGRDARSNAIESIENETYIDRLSRPLSYQTNYNSSNNFCKIKKSTYKTSSNEQTAAWPKRVHLPVACQPNNFNSFGIYHCAPANTAKGKPCIDKSTPFITPKRLDAYNAHILPDTYSPPQSQGSGSVATDENTKNDNNVHTNNDETKSEYECKCKSNRKSAKKMQQKNNKKKSWFKCFRYPLRILIKGRFYKRKTVEKNEIKISQSVPVVAEQTKEKNKKKRFKCFRNPFKILFRGRLYRAGFGKQCEQENKKAEVTEANKMKAENECFEMTESTEEIAYIENIEKIQKTENIENIEKIQETENIENIEKIQEIENIENIENTEKFENSQNIQKRNRQIYRYPTRFMACR